MKEGVYSLEIFHERRKPVPQKFTIRGYMLFVDVSRFDSRDASRLLGFDRRRLHSFRRSDFSLLRDSSETSRGAALAFLKKATGLTADTVMLLANPAIFGYVFNPVSFFFCYRNGAHVATIVEVNNTFGQQKHYLVRAGERYNAQKNFYVSPFISSFHHFAMRLGAPADRLSIGIHTQKEGKAELVAEMRGTRSPLTDLQLLAAFFKFPFYTARVIVMIHWYALRLMLKGVPFYPKENTDAALLHADLRSSK
ncbi:DUF1365 domain-containing protein [Turneriella parva]|uniref:DUF1365 domain-containing protein n=1 Tax=Turneriella parva (strain ATCC BAA-1111 / DSM 21527 / NCTC 11395 / H) TaxID=869212 RepID=I4B758_TURPD|nr:DUF1365 domain-containing protein [Turneriella parva]AFM13115.1 protein of unknown function DUF1365 [Turneriella parva DSM 21527]